MDDSARKIIELFLKGMAAGGGRAGGSGSFMEGRALGGSDDYTSSGYPEQFSPQHDHYYDVVKVGPDVHNAMGVGDPNVERGGTMQTLKEHNDALLKYVRMLRKDATPREVRAAFELGKQEELKLPRFWLESKTRENARFNVSSSAVTGIRVTPDGHVEVKWKGPSKNNPTGWYTFGSFKNPQEASRAAVELMKKDSIGRAVMPKKIAMNLKNPVPGAGAWNMKYYNKAYAV